MGGRDIGTPTNGGGSEGDRLAGGKNEEEGKFRLMVKTGTDGTMGDIICGGGNGRVDEIGRKCGEFQRKLKRKRGFLEKGE